MPTSNLFQKSLQYLVLSLGTLLFLTSVNTAAAATLDVCTTCTYSTITDAHAAASPAGGDTIEITENITEDTSIAIDRGVTITCSPGVTVDEVDFFSISAENVTIDGCEFTQSLTTCDAMGAAFVTATGANDNIQITDNIIDNYAEVLTSTNNTNLVFTGNTVTEACADSSIYLNTTTASIEDNSFTQTASCFDGMVLDADNSSDLVFSTNTITNYSEAISGGYLIDFTVSDNIFSNACTAELLGGIFSIDGAPGIISGNQITSPMEKGLFLGYYNGTVSSGSTYIQDNIITGTTTTKDPDHGTEGISFEDSTKTLDLYVDNNTIQNDGYTSGTYLGIGMSGGDAKNLSITNNDIAGFFAYGIDMEGDKDIDDIEIINNVLYAGSVTTDYGYQYGIRFYDSVSGGSEALIGNGTIKDNIIANMKTGIDISLEVGGFTALDNDYNAYWGNETNIGGGLWYRIKFFNHSKSWASRH
jgi:hypothetical protein